jgi:hypothetical protein
MSKKYTSQHQFPQDNYLVRCTSAGFGPSKTSGKPMITLEFEILSPEVVEIGGEQFTVAGIQTRPSYHVTQSIDGEGNLDAEKTETIKENLDKLCEAFQLPLIDNPENPVVDTFVGKVVWALVNSEKFEKRKSPTADQLKRGEKQGDILKNPITGEPLVSYYPKIERFFGVPAADVVSAATANRPF